MAYYFPSKVRTRGIANYSKATQLKYLKEGAFKHLRVMAPQITALTGLELNPYWISRATLGAVLCDYDSPKTGPSILGAHKSLLDLIADNVD